jgi:hypothetical protein
MGDGDTKAEREGNALQVHACHLRPPAPRQRRMCMELAVLEKRNNLLLVLTASPINRL